MYTIDQILAKVKNIYIFKGKKHLNKIKLRQTSTKILEAQKSIFLERARSSNLLISEKKNSRKKNISFVGQNQKNWLTYPNEVYYQNPYNANQIFGESQNFFRDFAPKEKNDYRSIIS